MTTIYLVQANGWHRPLVKSLSDVGGQSIWTFGLDQTEPFRIFSFDADELHRDLATSIRDVTEDVLTDLYSNFDDRDFYTVCEEASEWAETPWALREFFPEQTAAALRERDIRIDEAA